MHCEAEASLYDLSMGITILLGSAILLSLLVLLRGVISGHRVSLVSGVSGRVKIEFCVHIYFCIIVNPF